MRNLPDTHTLIWFIKLDQARIVDQSWYVSDVRKFQNHYPNCKYEYDMKRTITEMIQAALNK